MKILLDECVNQRLAQDFIGQKVSTVSQMGWKSKGNGELLALPAKVLRFSSRQIETCRFNKMSKAWASGLWL